jgi:hypothetical protein
LHPGAVRVQDRVQNLAQFLLGRRPMSRAYLRRSAAVSIAINGHDWRSRLAITRGRHLIDFSKVKREADEVETGDAVEAELTLDTEPGTSAMRAPDGLMASAAGRADHAPPAG